MGCQLLDFMIDRLSNLFDACLNIPFVVWNTVANTVLGVAIYAITKFISVCS